MLHFSNIDLHDETSTVVKAWLKGQACNEKEYVGNSQVSTIHLISIYKQKSSKSSNITWVFNQNLSSPHKYIFEIFYMEELQNLSSAS
jgi:hypothetical protein